MYTRFGRQSNYNDDFKFRTRGEQLIHARDGLDN